MKPMARVVALLGCLFLAGCGSTRTATTDVDTSVDFSSFKTFGWIDPNPLIRSVTVRPLSPLIEPRLMANTREILESKGLRFVEDPLDADLAVAFTVGSREGMRVESFPTTSFSRSPRGRRDYRWGSYWGGSTVRTRTYTEGQLAVDIFDVEQARPVWHGTTSTRITSGDRAEPDALIRDVLETILAEFPPG